MVSPLISSLKSPRYPCPHSLWSPMSFYLTDISISLFHPSHGSCSSVFAWLPAPSQYCFDSAIISSKKPSLTALSRLVLTRASSSLSVYTVLSSQNLSQSEILSLPVYLLHHHSVKTYSLLMENIQRSRRRRISLTLISCQNLGLV